MGIHIIVSLFSANLNMDTVPRLFIEGVYFLLDRRSRGETRRILPTWDIYCSAISKKSHTLQVLLDGSSKKIYAAALPALDMEKLLSIWREISLDYLQRLVHFIRPVKNERHPLVYDYFSFNPLTLKRGSRWINGQLLSLQLPADTVDLEIDKREEAEKFFENAGPLYSVNYLLGPTLEPSTLDALIEKFVPIDGGHVHERFSKGSFIVSDQITSEKCDLSAGSLPSDQITFGASMKCDASGAQFPLFLPTLDAIDAELRAEQDVPNRTEKQQKYTKKSAVYPDTTMFNGIVARSAEFWTAD
uniref:Nucleolar protein 6 n=1 Tax=Steinernema glaseri TaxID=37863 RepID=A0A1I7YM74_9BILA